MHDPPPTGTVTVALTGPQVASWQAADRGSSRCQRKIQTDNYSVPFVLQLRKEQGITQVQLAETLGVSQQTITAYEVGRRRIQVSALPVIAQALGVSVEALVADAPKPARRGPAPKLQQQLERVQALPKAKQRLVSEVLDSLLAQGGR
ncbi:MAG: helix-turn-helix transcriptional regulator [Dokdonella sp.]|uniref:helix-turn-helix domain-containing protein n=1 Tax=Dokdonella sp. TaxID=2291710 RepID=UPI0025C41FF4|nr:helix-turn-helix transcriptional regulator [Dokdonella sp.]MBZ0223203.1 helix-turn-helix transcriptional regulator [Dokdonella sp.]